MDYVFAACGDEDNQICVQLAGGSYEFYDTYVNADENKSSFESNGTYAFRITLVDNDGNRYKYNGKDTKSYDYYTNSDSRLSGDYYYNSYKFFNNTNFSTSYDINRSYEILKGSNDFSTLNGISSFWKKKLGVDKTQLTNDMKTVLTNAGITDINDQNEIFKKGDLYVVIERIFKIKVSYLSERRKETKKVYREDPSCASGCSNIVGDDRNQCMAGCIQPYTVSYYVQNEAAKYFVGTGRSIAILLNNYYYGNTKYSISSSSIIGLDFLRSNVFVNDIGRMRIDDMTDINNWNFGPKLNKITTLKKTDLTSWNTIYDRDSKWSELEAQNRTIDILVLKITSGGGITEECKTERNAISMGLDWDSVHEKCCDEGKIFNSKTKTCGGSLTFNPTSGQTTTYTYTASPSVNICKDSTVNSTIKNLSSCSYKVNNGSSTNASLADCVLYNKRYYVGSYAGNDVYCMETLNTNFSNFRLNFASKYSSGKFIPISRYPSLTKNVTCYASGSSDTSLYTYLNTSGIKNLATNMKVKVNFLNENNYQFVNSSKNITENNKSTGKTKYGQNYTSLNFSVLYNYSYVNDSLNKYIKIQNAQGSIDKINSRYKTMTQNINFNIPTDTEPGTYSTSISLDGLDSNISKITDGTDYEKARTFTTGGSGKYCKLEYSAKKDNIYYCGREFRNKLSGDNIVGYSANYTKGVCNINIVYSGVTESYCDSLETTTSTTEFITSGNTTILNFNNNLASSNISCSFNIDVGKKIEDILIYRPIDLSNPFPGKNGKGRTAGSNWSKSDITNYITSRQDAYTKKPMYSFTLTPSNIKTIREYNKTHTYDDFNLNCRGEGSACFSQFIATYKGMMNKDKSSCYFATKEERTVASFNSCADYTKR